MIPMTPNRARATRITVSMNRLSARDAAIDFGLAVVFAGLFASWRPESLLYEVFPTFSMDPRTLLALRKCLELSMAIVMAIALLWIRRLSPYSLGVDTRGLSDQVVIGVMGAFLAVLCVALEGVPIWWYLRNTMLNPRLSGAAKYLPEGFRARQYLVPLVTVLAAGLTEDIVFHGLMLPRLYRVLGTWPRAIALGSIVFTAAHCMTGWGPILTLGPSIILAILFVRTGSLVTSAVAHIVYDLLILLAAETIHRFSQ